MSTRTRSQVFGSAAIVVAVVAGCASITGLDELQKVDCVANCDAGNTGGQSGSGGTSSGGGYVFDLGCISYTGCSATMMQICCGRHPGGNDYTSACEPSDSCLMNGGIMLCDQSVDVCTVGSCEIAASFPEHGQCKFY